MLDSDSIEKIRAMMYTSGYREVFKPILEERLKNLRALAMMLPSERPEPYKQLDDASATAILKGEGRSLEWVLNVFENEVKIADFNRRNDEQILNSGKPAETVPANPD